LVNTILVQLQSLFVISHMLIGSVVISVTVCLFVCFLVCNFVILYSYGFLRRG